MQLQPIFLLSKRNIMVNPDIDIDKYMQVQPIFLLSKRNIMVKKRERESAFVI